MGKTMGLDWIGERKRSYSNISCVRDTSVTGIGDKPG